MLKGNQYLRNDDEVLCLQLLEDFWHRTYRAFYQRLIDRFAHMSDLPNELPLAENIELARRFVQKTFVSKGMCADVCIHDPERDQPNVHAHIMLTMRPINPDGSWGEKQRKEYVLDSAGNKIYDKKKRTYKCRTVQTTDWNSRDKAEEWRAAWADFLNAVLEEKGIADRVDHRSFERQGKLEQPTIHMGVSATQMERKGIRTEKGDINRRIKEQNDELHRLQAELEKVNAAIAELQKRPQGERYLHRHDQDEEVAAYT